MRAAALAVVLVAAAAPARAEAPASVMVVDSEPPGAEVTINGRVQGTTPWSGPRAPGRQEVEVRLEGYAPQRRVVEHRGGPDALRHTFVLEPEVVAAPEPEPEPEPEPQPQPQPVEAEELEGTVTYRVAGLVTEGLAIGASSVLRSNVRLEAMFELDMGWVQPLAAVSVALEEPASFGLSAGWGFDIWGPLHARLLVAFLTNPAFEIGIAGGLGADIGLTGALFLHAGVDATLWPGLHQGPLIVALEARLGLGAQF